MSKKIYIGDQEIGTGSGGGGQTVDTSAFVDVSTWDEHEKVIASALIDIKKTTNNIEEFDADIQDQHTALSTQVQTLSQDKADASTVYVKTDIDKSDKVVAQALMVLDERLRTIESSTGTIDTSVVNAASMVVAGDPEGDYIALDPMSGTIDFSFSGETGFISLTALYALMQNQ